MKKILTAAGKCLSAFWNFGKSKMGTAKDMQIAINFNAEYPPHQIHSDTSRAAAAVVAKKFNSKTLQLLQDFRDKWPAGITDEHGQIDLGIDGNSYRPMRVTLYKYGYISDSGERKTLKSGRKGAVWIITSSGLSKLKEENL